MRTSIIPWLLSLSLIFGGGSALADNHRGNRGNHRTEQNVKKNDKGKKENHKINNHRYDRRPNGKAVRPGTGNNRPGNNAVRPGNSHSRPGSNAIHHAPVKRPQTPHHAAPPKPHMVRGPKHYPHHYTPVAPLPVMLSDMVAFATRGCHDVNVWQINPETFIVRYRNGSHYYTQMIYPYTEMYGPRNSISIGWTPSSPWTLIPSVNLNINL